MNMRNILLLSIFFLSFNCIFAQNLKGTWKTSILNNNSSITWKFNADNTGYVINNFTTIEKYGKFTITNKCVMTLAMKWNLEGNTLSMLTNPSETTIKVTYKVTGGTVSERARLQEEANYQAQQEENSLYEDLNPNTLENLYTIEPITASTIKIITSEDEKLIFHKVIPKK